MNISWTTFLSCAIILLVIDFIYLHLTSSIFQRVVRRIQGGIPLTLNWMGGLLSYACLVIALYVFILLPNYPPSIGFLLGFCIYGVFDGTTIALFDAYPWSVAWMDTLWGGVLFMTVTYIIQMIFA